MPKQLCIPAIAISFSTFGSVIGHAAPSCWCCRLIQLSLPATCWLYFDYRWDGADPGRIRAYAKELVSLNPDAILVSTALTLQPLLQETHSIPIVFMQIIDPVGSGFITSLAHPGGNISGFTPAEFSMFGKLLEVLHEIAPVTHVAVIHNPDQAPQLGMWRAIEAAAPSFRVQLTAAGVRDIAGIERAIDQFAREPNPGLIVLPSPVTEGNRKLIIALAARHRLPAAYAFRHFVADGGLISYGVDLPTSTDRLPRTSIASCAARSPPICRSNSRPSSSSFST
jgi:putative tryptophan/tyrosine transport system substrate-binding protein